MFKAQHARPSAIAGRWYPGNPAKLTQEIQAYFDQADPMQLDGDLLAVVVPHAGYIYSGQTAAYAFKLLQGNSYQRIILLSPFHAMTFEELLTTSYPAYETPLGKIPVDHDAIDRIDQHLTDHGQAPIHRIRVEQEHSLEIELPFLQTILTEPFELIPIMVRQHEPTALQVLAAILADLAQEKPTLLVASTDLSHFHPANTAEILDSHILNDIQKLAPEELLEDNRTGRGAACGAGAVAATLFAALQLGANHTEILHYTHSGNITGDNSSVVGYGAAAIYRRK